MFSSPLWEVDPVLPWVGNTYREEMIEYIHLPLPAISSPPPPPPHTHTQTYAHSVKTFTGRSILIAFIHNFHTNTHTSAHKQIEKHLKSCYQPSLILSPIICLSQETQKVLPTSFQIPPSTTPLAKLYVQGALDVINFGPWNLCVH